MSPIYIYASLVTFLVSIINFTNATTITVVNNCPYTVWAAADPGSGQQLSQGNSWDVNPPPGSSMARIWGRTGCNFDGNGNGNCETGGCGKLDCDPGFWGEKPKTVLEYTLTPDHDTIDISLIEGFNIPISFTPASNIGAIEGKCRDIRCTADINGQCPGQFRVSHGHGCNNPCTAGGGSCGPNGDSQFFKNQCPDVYSNPHDDQTSTFACPSGTNYKLTFCP